MPETPNRRLFFALRPHRAVRERIAGACAHCIPASARPVVLDNLHMTLAFLGSVDTATRLCVEQAADRVSTGPFQMTLEQIGHWRRPQILWLGPLEVPARLTELERGLETELAACGFRAEEKSYRPHVTLARKVSGQLLPQRIEPVDWAVEAFCLMESCTGPEGVQYHVLRQWPLRAA